MAVTWFVEEPSRKGGLVTITSGQAGVSPDQVDAAVIENLFRQHGAILFRGFHLDPASFERASDRFCSSYLTSGARNRRRISPDASVQTVNLGHEAFPLHPEMSHAPWRPDIAWFACANPPGVGGKTLLCDGELIVEAMPRDLHERLEGRSLLYRLETPRATCVWALGNNNPDEEVLARHREQSPDFYFTIEDGKYFQHYITPFFYRSLYRDAPVFGNFLLFARILRNMTHYPLFEGGSHIPDDVVEGVKAISDAWTIEINWRQNDLVMVDNWRFMHGRTAVDDPDARVILTRFGYSSILPEDRLHWRQQRWRQPAG